ncbi:MAG: AAA family ATPase [Isosphaerales bacterium]
MSDSQWEDDANLAIRLVRTGLSVLKDAGTIVKERIGALSVFSEEEKEGFAAFQARIAAYSTVEKPKHPLCLGVFGPPGSGKTFAVEQILKPKGHMLRVINLSQLEGPSDLSSALVEVARWPVDKLPIVFFDEFDSRLAGASLGWLQWLLAPMQDGIVVDHGHAVEIKRAVFVFAGGTADRFEEFPETHGGYFRSAKGPDFISRMRDHLNVRGVNEWPYRRVRRALVLRRALERVAPRLFDGESRIPEQKMTDEFIDQLLSIGRFIHGSRSVEAIVEMSMGPNSESFTTADLPTVDMLASHVDSGPLGGLAIALSAGGDRRDGETGDYSPELDDVWTRVATRLLEFGAGLVYGGDLRPGGFTTRLAEAHSRMANAIGQRLEQDTGPFARPRPARVTCFQSIAGEQHPQGPEFERVDFRLSPALSEGELTELGLPSTTDLRVFNRQAEPISGWRTSRDWCCRLGYTLVLFRLRAQITRLADAMLVFGGRDFGSTGRFPGIAEEVMLGLASGAAVYVCGGFGGASHAVGQLLGLGDPWSVVPDCLQRDQHGPGAATLEAAVKGWGRRFQLPHRDNLPLDHEALVQFLSSHAVGGSQWPDNGLTAEENRTLFRTTSAEQIIRAVTKGLRRRLADVR